MLDSVIMFAGLGVVSGLMAYRILRLGGSGFGVIVGSLLASSVGGGLGAFWFSHFPTFPPSYATTLQSLLVLVAVLAVTALAAACRYEYATTPGLENDRLRRLMGRSVAVFALLIGILPPLAILDPIRL